VAIDVAQTLRDDALRRLIREHDESLAFERGNEPEVTANPRAMAIRSDARKVGMVTALDTRVSPRWTPTVSRPVGIAPGTEHLSDGTPTVAVWNLFQRHGVRIVDHASLRKGRARAHRQQPTAAAPITPEVVRRAESLGTQRDYD
jgi:hypothetical protein